MDASPAKLRPGLASDVSRGSRLCLSCGICCQGIFFFHDNDPAKYGIAVARVGGEAGERQFSLACRLYRDGCLIHEHPDRPRCCRESQCQVLRRVLSNEISLDEGVTIVARIKSLLSSIRAATPAPDDSRPFIESIRSSAAWARATGEGAERPSVAFLMDLAALELLLHRYLLPIEGV